MTDMVQVALAEDVTEAEELQAILQSAGIESKLETAVMHHPREVEDAPQKVLVPESELEAAQQVVDMFATEALLAVGDERRLVVEEWNRTDATYPDDACIHALFEAQAHLADSTLMAIARNLQLDLPRFEACVKLPRVALMVERDAAEAAEAGLSVTPSFVIGKAADGKVTGAVVSGALPLDRFRTVIRDALGAATAPARRTARR